MSILVKSNAMCKLSKEKITKMTESQQAVGRQASSAEKLRISCSSYSQLSVNSCCQSLTLLLNTADIYCYTMVYKEVDDNNLSPALIITVLVFTVHYTSVSHFSLNFEAPCLRYGFLSISVLLHYLILVLEKLSLIHI